MSHAAFPLKKGHRSRCVRKKSPLQHLMFTHAPCFSRPCVTSSVVAMNSLRACPSLLVPWCCLSAPDRNTRSLPGRMTCPGKRARNSEPFRQLAAGVGMSQEVCSLTFARVECYPCIRARMESELRGWGEVGCQSNWRKLWPSG